MLSSPAGEHQGIAEEHRLSDDISMRFSNHDWAQWPLTAEKFAAWVSQINGHGDLCNLFLDYETFANITGPTPASSISSATCRPRSSSAATTSSSLRPGPDRFAARSAIDVPHMVSWADPERDLSTWLGNAMQSNALHELFKLEGPLKDCGDRRSSHRLAKAEQQRHFYYMCTKNAPTAPGTTSFQPVRKPYDVTSIS